ncbi:3-oxoacyl-[acyl-carrier-protein] synthase III C-terminal domain-containing protein [Micromonospora sp. HUAS YX12]|uniref:3-oxoacyl-[acyl-carrier-protein] synthase III C-terminal domain-containing protein n=1 Tax=Micromonospora sp. HUAS YX12 TaxID=3156396 RepID=A0AAU7R3T4_9ACTN
MSFGILAIDHALGEPRSVADDAAAYVGADADVAAWGYQTFYRAPDGVGVTDLAAQAGQAALDRAGISAADVDLVLLAMADVAEYLYWDPAAATQAKLGALRAEAFLVNQACSSGVAAFDVVAGKFATHPDHRVALLVSANRVCESYWNRMDSSAAITSDGAAAAVLVRDHDAYRWLTTEVVSDGRYADFCRLPTGGAARPFTSAADVPEQIGNPATLMNRFLGGDRLAMIRYLRHDRACSRTVVERACDRTGIHLADIRYVLHLNGTSKGLQDYAEQIGIPLERTNHRLARRYGHFGSADQIFTLGRLRDEGALHPGDIVALTSTGNGMHWACTLLRV